MMDMHVLQRWVGSMKKQMIYILLAFLMTCTVLSALIIYIPFVMEDASYEKFKTTAQKLLAKKVDKITKHSYKEGDLYQTPEGKIFGTWDYGDYCIEQVYPNDKPVIREQCSQFSYDTAASYIEKNTTNQELVSDNEATGKDTTMPFSSKKYFVGSNPNNYIYYSGSCYRIVNIAQNDTVKIVYEGPATSGGNCMDVADNNSGFIALLSWDEDKQRSGNFENASNLKDRLNRFYREEEINTVVIKQAIDTSVVEMVDWYIGKVNESNSTLLEDIQNERSEISTEPFPFGLLNNSDYLKISCQTSGGKSTADCSKNNYLYKSKYQWWTINYGEEKDAWFVTPQGNLLSDTIGYSNEYRFSGARMAFYLKADTLLTGNGTENSPYRIIK